MTEPTEPTEPSDPPESGEQPDPSAQHDPGDGAGPTEPADPAAHDQHQIEHDQIEHDPDGVPERERVGRGAAGLLLAAMAGLVLSLILAQVTLPYAIMMPGPVTNTLGDVVEGVPLIDVEGAPTFPTEGELNFTTVRIGGGPGNETNVWDYVSAQLSNDATLLPAEQLFPQGVTRTEIRQENQAQMEGSQQGAAAVALRALGHEVTETVTIVGVAEESDFADRLEDGDVVVAVNDVPTDGADAIRDEVAAVDPGGDIAVTIERDGTEQVVTGKTMDLDGRSVLGIFLSRAFSSDVEVSITAGDVGGPSAGMMFALAIYDVLTEGPLTGGAQISGTGEITPEGEVGPIGGIRQKVIGAKAAGSSFFLAPQDNCAELDGAVPDGISVFSIGTFDEALAAVEGSAADDVDALPRCG